MTAEQWAPKSGEGSAESQYYGNQFANAAANVIKLMFDDTWVIGIGKRQGHIIITQRNETALVIDDMVYYCNEEDGEKKFYLRLFTLLRKKASGVLTPHTWEGPFPSANFAAQADELVADETYDGSGRRALKKILTGFLRRTEIVIVK